MGNGVQWFEPRMSAIGWNPPIWTDEACCAKQLALARISPDPEQSDPKNCEERTGCGLAPGHALSRITIRAARVCVARIHGSAVGRARIHSRVIAGVNARVRLASVDTCIRLAGVNTGILSAVSSCIDDRWRIGDAQHWAKCGT